MVVLLELIGLKHLGCCGCCLHEVFVTEGASPVPGGPHGIGVLKGPPLGRELPHSLCFFSTTSGLDLAGTQS